MANKKQKKPPQEQPRPKKRKIQISSRHILSWAVFIPTVVIVFITLISVVFPALVIRTTSPFHAAVLGTDIIDPFTTGPLAAPLIVINVIILGIGFAYYKRSSNINNIFTNISSFELSKKQALIAVIALLAVFVGITAGTLATQEEWADYTDVKKRVDAWTISDFTKSFEPHVKYMLLSVSLHAFGNIRVIPMMISIALLLLTYFFTKQITQKRFAGLVSMALLLQSNVFVSYGTTATYDNSWILLYLFSLYLIQKFYQSSPISYFVSIFSKPLTIAFLPMSLYFIARSGLQRRSKLYSIASYGVIIIILLASLAAFKGIIPQGGANAAQFWQGFAAMSMQMRFDYVIVIFLLPLTVMLFFASRRQILHADSIMIFVLGILLSAPLLLGLTTQTNQPYRFVLLSVFFAIGVGVLLSKRTRSQQVELSSSD